MNSDKDMLLFLRERNARMQVDEVCDQIMAALEAAAGEDWDGMDPPTLEFVPGGINLIYDGETRSFISASEALDHLKKIVESA